MRIAANHHRMVIAGLEVDHGDFVVGNRAAGAAVVFDVRVVVDHRPHAIGRHHHVVEVGEYRDVEVDFRLAF